MGHTPRSRPALGVCPDPGRGAISRNGRKLVSLIGRYVGLQWLSQTGDQSRRAADCPTASPGGRGTARSQLPQRRAIKLPATHMYTNAGVKYLDDLNPHMTLLSTEIQDQTGQEKYQTTKSCLRRAKTKSENKKLKMIT